MTDGERITERIRPDPPPAPSPAREPSIEEVEEEPEESGQTAPEFGVSAEAKRKLPPNVYRFTPKTPPAVPQLSELFRYELDIRPLKTKPGYKVRIRRRLKWSSGRYSRNVITTHCPDLTAAMLRRIHAGKLTAAITAAFEHGGIGNEVTQTLCRRPGRGHGKRASELTDDERSLLRRFERALARDGESRNRETGS